MPIRPDAPARHAAATMELPAMPYLPEQITEGSPDASAVILWQPDDDSLVRTGIWGCTPGAAEYKQQPTEMSEFVILSGRAVIRFADRDPIEVSAGDVLHLPEGTTSIFDVKETVRTYYCVYV
jgi:uncharacterized cupin superfamily protein